MEILQRAEEGSAGGPKIVPENVNRKFNMSWSGITYKVPSKQKNGEKKTILNNVSGFVDAGEMLAIMGPSGCGKTTLLDVLADRIATGELSGEIHVSGHSRSHCFRFISSYVPQEDSLMGVLTVRETLSSAAELVVRNKTAKEREALVEHLIDDLGLRVCANAFVGDMFHKGISGGQKRRVSMAIELLSSPLILILDEPTSGLDSASAVGVMAQMVKLAKSGVLVMATIHQPSSGLYRMFDKLYLMVKGETVYFGAASEAVRYFGQLGLPCPEFTNPADFLLEVVNTDFDGHADVRVLVESYKRSTNAAEVESQLSFATSNPAEMTVPICSPAPFWQQFFTLSKRNLINATRNPGLYWVRLIMYTLLSIMVGSMYWQIGHGYETMQDRVAMLFYIAAFMVFMSVAVLPFFIEGRAVFVRERANGSFNVLPWVVSHWVCGLPGIFAIAFVSSVICYFASGLRSGGFGWFLLDLYLALLTAESFMSLMSALVPHYIVGIALGAGVYGMFMLCEGFMIIKSNIPPYWIWGYYIGFHTYSFRAFMTNEFRNLPVDYEFPNQPFFKGDDVLKFYDMEDGVIEDDLAILFCFGIAFEILFYFVLDKYHTGKR